MVFISILEKIIEGPKLQLIDFVYKLLITCMYDQIKALFMGAYLTRGYQLRIFLVPRDEPECQVLISYLILRNLGDGVDPSVSIYRVTMA